MCGLTKGIWVLLSASTFQRYLSKLFWLKGIDKILLAYYRYIGRNNLFSQLWIFWGGVLHQSLIIGNFNVESETISVSLVLFSDTNPLSVLHFECIFYPAFVTIDHLEILVCWEMQCIQKLKCFFMRVKSTLINAYH